MIQIAIMGHGVVGSGVVEVFQKNYESIRRKTGCEMEIKRILDLREFPELPYADLFTKDFGSILEDDGISVVVEVMGGLTPAYSFVKQCLERGKSVVTSNKELVAAKGAELLAAAQEHNASFLFEASVGGGIPIIRPLHQCLAANEIDEIAGILNGTTNYILTKMVREQAPFKDALREAQALGYAERDPSADVLGHDACRKICILASLAFGRHIYPEFVSAAGITEISPEDVADAEAWGGVIKLIGSAKRLPDGRVAIEAAPAFLNGDSPLAGVDDVFNAILVRGDATGDVVFYGKGAGKLPTASAVVADIIDAVKAGGRPRSMCWRDGGPETAVPHGELRYKMYLRAQCGAETLRELVPAKMLARADRPAGQAACILNEMSYDELDALKASLEGRGVRVLSTIRVLEY